MRNKFLKFSQFFSQLLRFFSVGALGLLIWSHAVTAHAAVPSSVLSGSNTNISYDLTGTVYDISGHTEANVRYCFSSSSVDFPNCSIGTLDSNIVYNPGTLTPTVSIPNSFHTTYGNYVYILVNPIAGGTSVPYDDYMLFTWNGTIFTFTESTLFGAVSIDDIVNSLIISSPLDGAVVGSPFAPVFSGRYNYVAGTSLYPYNKLHFAIVNMNDLTAVSTTDVDLSTTSGSFSFDVGTLLDNKSYSFQIYFYDDTDSSVPPFYSNTVYFTTGDGGGLVTGATYYAICPEGTIANAFSIVCHAKNLLIWAFVPNPSVLNKFSTLTLRDSKPFSYVYDMGVLYDDVFNQTASDFDITIPFGSGDITLLSTDKLEAIPFQGLVRTILGALMMFGTAMLVYRRVIKIHDHGHKTTA